MNNMELMRLWKSGRIQRKPFYEKITENVKKYRYLVIKKASQCMEDKNCCLLNYLSIDIGDKEVLNLVTVL